MRYGILSDTHANIEALEAVFKAFESEGIDRYVCLGDTVGYGASPNEACSLMRSKVAFAILGNHDAAVAGRMDYSYYYYAARHALDKHAQILEQGKHGLAEGAALRGARERRAVLSRLAAERAGVRLHLRPRPGRPLHEHLGSDPAR